MDQVNYLAQHSPTTMNYLHGILSRPQERQRPAALSSSILNRVPVEILLSITDYLPLESAVAFSLSCTHLKDVLGTQHFLKVAYSTENLVTLLNLLALDLRNYVACSPCRKLHNMKNIRRYNITRYNGCSPSYEYHILRLPACVAQDRAINTFTITELFGSTAFKMAVKRYHQQPDCTRLLKIMSSTEATTTKIGDYVRQFKEECRVVRGRLMHRLQSAYILQDQRSDIFPFIHNTPSEVICPHIKFGTSVYETGPIVKRCQECCTDYRIDFKYYDCHGWAMFFTRWKNLGTGPDSEVWRQHYALQSAELRALRAYYLPSEVQIQDSVGLQSQGEAQSQDRELSSAFGDGNDFKFDSLLTPENQAELFRFQE
jgi:hypothetical protein